MNDSQPVTQMAAWEIAKLNSTNLNSNLSHLHGYLGAHKSNLEKDNLIVPQYMEQLDLILAEIPKVETTDQLIANLKTISPTT